MPLAGQLNEASHIATRTAELVAERGFRGSQAQAILLLGEINARRNPAQVDRAEDCYREALALAEELGMRPLTASCRFRIAELHQQKGNLAAAREHFDQATALFRKMEMDWWLEQAEKLGKSLGAS